MRRLLATSLAGAAIAAMGMAAPAQGQLVPTAPACDPGDMSILNEFNPNADDCLGAFEGNSNQQLGLIEQAMLDAGWFSTTEHFSYLGSSDAENGEPNPFTSGWGEPTGTLTLAGSLTGDLVLILKASNQFSVYFFQDVVNVTEIDYTTAGVSLNKQGMPQGESHTTLILVPEPGSALLMLTGLLGVAAVAGRRREDLVA